MARCIFILFVVLSCFYYPHLISREVLADKFTHSDFSFEAPNEWTWKKDVKGANFIFMREIPSEVMPTIIIAIGDTKQNFTLDDCIEETTNIVSAKFPEAKFFSKRKVYTGKVEWYEMVYQYTDEGFSFQVIQYHTAHNKKHYVVTGHSLQSNFSEYLDDFKKTFNSWKFVAE